MKNYRLFSIFLHFVILALTIFVFSKLKTEEKTILNYASILGTSLSLSGLVLAYFQIMSIKQANRHAISAVESSLAKINQILSVSDISKCIKNIDEIQNYIIAKNIPLALLRMKDIRGVIIGVKHNEKLKHITNKKEYTSLLTTFEIDTDNINGYIDDPSRNINFVKITNNLDKLAIKLTEIEKILINM